MRLPPLFWPLILLVLASADCGMVFSSHPPVGIFSLALPGVVAIAAAVALVTGSGGVGAATGSALAVVAALFGFSLGYLLPASWLLVVLVALALGSAVASTIWLKSKGAAK